MSTTTPAGVPEIAVIRRALENAHMERGGVERVKLYAEAIAAFDTLAARLSVLERERDAAIANADRLGEHLTQADEWRAELERAQAATGDMDYSTLLADRDNWLGRLNATERQLEAAERRVQVLTERIESAWDWSLWAQDNDDLTPLDRARGLHASIADLCHLSREAVSGVGRSEEEK